jgi:hypothetical protein
MTDLAGLLAEFAATDTAAIQRAAGDRRALIAADIAATLAANGRKSGPAEVGREIGRTRQYAAELLGRAVKVRASHPRLAAALALGGPIPTVTPDRRAS